ncbi:hypothetical protein B1B_16831, partial [mine drainage metagenome]
RLRSVDAYAISLWNSRGHEIQGFEIKASRSDWLVELSDPQKAEAGARFSDRWWVCAPKGVVHQSELPEGWGLIVPIGKGLREQVKPAKHSRLEPPRDWWISALKKLAQRPGDEEISRRLYSSYQDGLKQGRDEHRFATEHVKGELDRLQKSVGEFEATSGIKLSEWNGGERGEGS